MPVPDFSPGEVLTASAMDSIGLWLVKTQTVGTAVSNVTVTEAFNTNFVNYRVVVEGIDCSISDSALFIRPGGIATGTPYSSGGYYVLYTGTGVGYLNSNATNDGIAVGITSTDFTSLAFDVLAPNVARWTRSMGHWSGDLYSGSYGGVMKTTTAYTSLELRPASGTMTGGTIRVYGYRN